MNSYNKINKIITPLLSRYLIINKVIRKLIPFKISIKKRKIKNQFILFLEKRKGLFP